MKIIKSVAMIAVVAGICGTSAYASGHTTSAPGGAAFALAGFVMIGLSSVLRRRTRRSL